MSDSESRSWRKSFEGKADHDQPVFPVSLVEGFQCLELGGVAAVTGGVDYKGELALCQGTQVQNLLGMEFAHRGIQCLGTALLRLDGQGKQQQGDCRQNSRHLRSPEYDSLSIH